MSENAAGQLNEHQNTDPEVFITVNTIDQAAYLERLPSPEAISRGHSNILRYGNDNLYPNKIKSMAQRSQSTRSAIKTLSRFSFGQGFTDDSANDLVINNNNQTLADMLRHSAEEKSSLGVALHFNYNILGQIIEIQEVQFNTLRWRNDMEKLIFCKDWSRSNRFKDNSTIEFDLFNPDNVQAEINAAGGIDKYNGQILYWFPNFKDTYPLATFDPCLDDVQFEHESGVYKIKNIQNSYSAGYITFYPSGLESELEKAGLIGDIKKSRGAKYAGRTKAVPINASAMAALGSRKMIEEIPRTGIDKMFKVQNEESRFNIFATFNQPPILNGISKDGMFNAESFVDAFDYYNSITEVDRNELERIFNMFLPYTIWGIDSVEIEPLEYKQERNNSSNGDTETE